MDRFGDAKKKAVDAAAGRLPDRDSLKAMGITAGHAASDAVVRAADAIDGFGTVLDDAGLKNKEGKVTKPRIAMAMMRPRKTAVALARGTANEVVKQSRESATSREDARLGSGGATHDQAILALEGSVPAPDSTD